MKYRSCKWLALALSVAAVLWVHNSYADEERDAHYPDLEDVGDLMLRDAYWPGVNGYLISNWDVSIAYQRHENQSYEVSSEGMLASAEDMGVLMFANGLILARTQTMAAICGDAITRIYIDDDPLMEIAFGVARVMIDEERGNESFAHSALPWFFGTDQYTCE